MKFLIDTNLLIPIVPGSKLDITPQSSIVAELFRLIEKTRQEKYIHPAVYKDFARDKDNTRKMEREVLLRQFQELPNPPQLTPVLKKIIADPPLGTNDWVDNCQLAAVADDAVDFLVTLDGGIHRKAARLGLASRVLSAQDAILVLENLFEKPTAPLPAATKRLAHELNLADQIFQSLRGDYPEFDPWMTKVRREHRTVWTLEVGGEEGYAGLAIINPEQDKWGLAGKTLKLCTFKISERFSGLRLGELLLRSILEYAEINGYNNVFVEVLPKHLRLLDFFEDFGFSILEGKSARNGQLILSKTLNASIKQNMSAWEYHQQFGPFKTKFEGNKTFVIPIQPKYHKLLFPELEDIHDLFAGQNAFGNSIKKAYLCHSKIKSIAKGDNILFYRSTTGRALTCLSIVEDVLRSKNPDEIARFVGKRTVYPFSEIKRMCEKQVLAVCFRQVKNVLPAIPFADLKAARILLAAPQSITAIKGEKQIQWLRERLKA